MLSIHFSAAFPQNYLLLIFHSISTAEVILVYLSLNLYFIWISDNCSLYRTFHIIISLIRNRLITTRAQQHASNVTTLILFFAHKHKGTD